RLLADLNARVERVNTTAARAKRRPRVGFLEWLDPLFCGGHWNPELVELAGGEDAGGRKGQDSGSISREGVGLSAPDAVGIACCGFSEERARQDLPILEAHPGYAELPAVRAGRVHVVDGAAYFSRPSQRLVDSLELLARFLHPDLFEGADAPPGQ